MLHELLLYSGLVGLPEGRGVPTGARATSGDPLTGSQLMALRARRKSAQGHAGVGDAKLMLSKPETRTAWLLASYQFLFRLKLKLTFCREPYPC